jgi:hypothetical protein
MWNKNREYLPAAEDNDKFCFNRNSQFDCDSTLRSNATLTSEEFFNHQRAMMEMENLKFNKMNNPVAL